MKTADRRSNEPRSGAACVGMMLTVLLAFVLAGCSSTQPLGVQVSDAEIATKIKTKLTADPEVNPFRVDVDVNEGVVRLSGTVEKAAARREAARLARQTEGVRAVRNDLIVGTTSAGERVDAARIATAAKAKIAADPQLNPFNIDVDAEGSVVTLSGRVSAEKNKDHAEELAASVKGVTRVVNLLEVGDLSDRDR